MKQEALFHEDIYEALCTDIQALGGAKKVGSMLWPEKYADKAGEHLRNCLNRTRQEKLDPEQEMLIIREARKIGSYAAMAFRCADAGFAEPIPVEPEDEAAKLQRQFIEAQQGMAQLLKRMEKLSMPQLRGVS